MTTEHDYATTARNAIEIVCTGNLSRMPDFYNPDFIDHVNDTTFHGYKGGEESVVFYRAIFKQLQMRAEEQITEGNRVATRWVLTGTYHGRSVTLRGTTISRFADDGRIIEDHGHTDTVSLLRQIGVLRTLALATEILTRRVKLPQGALKRS